MGSSVYSEKYQAFLTRLRAARLEVGLTQVEVAERLQVPQSYVSKSESGERRLDVIELTEFAEIYKKPLAYFAYGLDKDPRTSL
jgi:transcriptional regulator with XRE-family HTH domain